MGVELWRRGLAVMTWRKWAGVYGWRSLEKGNTGAIGLESVGWRESAMGKGVEDSQLSQTGLHLGALARSCRCKPVPGWVPEVSFPKAIPTASGQSWAIG